MLAGPSGNGFPHGKLPQGLLKEAGLVTVRFAPQGLPADAHIKSAVAYSKSRISAIDGLAGVREKHRFIFSETSGDALVALGRDALTSGQLADIESRVGFIYLAVEVTYGSYFTKICEEFPIAPAENSQGAKLSARLGAYSLCSDPKSNDAN